jgi:hypothetical protein
MKRSICILFFLFIAAVLPAQKAPGYRGHRLFLLYDFQFHPDISHYTPSINLLVNANASYPKTTFLYSHSVALDYVINRHSSLGLSAQFLSFSGTYTPETINYNGTGYYVSFYLRRFKARKNAIAPLGKYLKPEISMLYYSGMQGTSAMTTFHSGPQVGLSYSVGRTYIVFNHLVIDRGIRFSLLNLYHTMEVRDQGHQSAEPAAAAVLNNQYVNLYVGIGLLP